MTAPLKLFSSLTNFTCQKFNFYTLHITFFSPPKPPDWLCSPPSFLSNGYKEHFCWG